MAIGIAACCPLTAQDQVMVTRLRLVRSDASLGLDQGLRIDATLSNNETLSGTAAIVRFLGNSPKHLARLPLNMSGDVDLMIDGMRIRANEVVIEASGEIKPSGNVRITLLR
jgi:hypothetical protein